MLFAIVTAVSNVILLLVAAVTFPIIAAGLKFGGRESVSNAPGVAFFVTVKPIILCFPSLLSIGIAVPALNVPADELIRAATTLFGPCLGISL